MQNLREKGLISSGHKPEDPVTWSELAAVLNRTVLRNSHPSKARSSETPALEGL